MSPTEPNAGTSVARRVSRPPNLLILGFAFLLVAWIGANAPGNAPDEPANYLKAVGAGSGQALGEPQVLALPTFGMGPEAARRIAWINANSRSFLVPAGLTPDRFSCYDEAFLIRQPATCSVVTAQDPEAERRVSYVGTYPPYVFALPGVLMARMPDALTALYLGRFVLAALTALLLAVAVRASWSGSVGSSSLVGLVLATSPMVLFLGTAIGANGVEIAGALATFAVVLRSARPEPMRWLWPAGAVAGSLTVLARPTGLLWLVLAVLLAVALHGPVRIARIAARGRERVFLGAPVVAVLLALGWDRLVQPHPAIDLQRVADSVTSVPSDLRRICVEWVGVFGWASLRMTPWAYRIWFSLAALLLVAAVLLGRTWRERLLAPGFAVLSVLLVGLLDLLVFRQTYFPVYGRYTLPLGMLVPLVAGHVVTLRIRDRRTRAVGRSATARVVDRALEVGPRVVLPLAALVQLCGLWTSARRAAVSVDGPVWFLGHSQFAPPGGWGPWLLAALVGTVALAAASLSSPNRSTAAAGR